MTEEEKKEFEEFLQWKREKEARLQKESAIEDDKKVQERCLEEKDNSTPKDKTELETGLEKNVDNSVKENGNSSALFFLGCVLAVIIIILVHPRIALVLSCSPNSSSVKYSSSL